MNKRIATRVVDTAAAAQTVIINKDPTDVYWLSYGVEVIGARGTIKIYDGLDANGKLVFQCEAGYAHFHIFDPPIPCEQACFISSDTGISCWTLAYASREWQKELK